MELNKMRLCLVIISNILACTIAELFTATSELETLLDTHKRVVDDFNDFIEKEEHKLLVLNKYLHIYREEQEKAMKDIPNYIGNPINAFTLIKRLTTDLDYIEDTINISTELVRTITKHHSDVKYPTLEDLTGAAQALTRLQEIYNLTVADLSNGILNGVAHSTPMSVADCYELGRALYNEDDFKSAIAWMTQALRKLKECKDPRTVKEADILEYISFSHYLLGDIKNALNWAKRLSKVAPSNTRVRSDILIYKERIAEEKANRLNRQLGKASGEKEKHKPKKELSICDQKIKIYKSLCRGEIGISEEITKRTRGMSRSLHCRYLHEHHPFLRLAPIKMELVYSQPDVLVFHEVLSDEEIKHIKVLSKPKLHRGRFQGRKTDNQTLAPNRISKFAWLSDEESPVVARVSQRVSDMTGLSVLSAEKLLVANYGVGGHYEPHFDFLPNIANTEKPHEKRIASVLFYMSDVVQGGATVFTELGLRVFPIKGAAVFWMNLHPSGEGDLSTMHASCPVILGSKWVCNKWIHQGGQEFRRPCSLDYQPEGFMRDLPRPVESVLRQSS